MILCVETDGAPNSGGRLPDCDIAVYGFGVGEVDYESELKGESVKFEEVARFSKTNSCGVVCGCVTKSRGVLRKSVCVADGGKLLGITDMNHVLDGEQFKSGAGLGLYSVRGCKVGVCVENDLLFPDSVKALAQCGCSVLIAIADGLDDGLMPLVIRAYSYLYGVPIILCAQNFAYFSEVTGAIACSTQKTALFEVNPRNRYHVVTTRQRGFFSDGRTDY